MRSLYFNRIVILILGYIAAALTVAPLSAQASDPVPVSSPILRTSSDNKCVYAHFLTWFKTKQFSGRWEMWKSDYADALHNPDDLLENGHRDIATTAYPLTDVYDSSDPMAIEYQFLLMKLAGIDGVIVDWDGRRINPYRHEALMKILPYLAKYHLKLILCLEEWCGYWPKGTFPDRKAELAAAAAEIRWMMDNLVNNQIYGTVGGRKPVIIFRKEPTQWFTPVEWEQLRPLIADHGGALIFGEGFVTPFAHVSDGRYFWAGSGTLAECERQYTNFLTLNQPEIQTSPPLVFGSAMPYFNDSPVWGWGGGPRISPAYQGQRFKRAWELSIEHHTDLVQLVTWNDWNEGTQIEPADTYGYYYLEETKKYAALYKGVPDSVPNPVLRLPLKLYQARQKAAKLADESRKAAIGQQLDQVRDALLEGSYEQAAKILQQAENLL
jgi:hypothetical protein